MILLVFVVAVCFFHMHTFVFIYTANKNAQVCTNEFVFVGCSKTFVHKQASSKHQAYVFTHDYMHRMKVHPNKENRF